MDEQDTILFELAKTVWGDELTYTQLKAKVVELRKQIDQDEQQQQSGKRRK